MSCEKVGITAENGGNSNFCFLPAFAIRNNAASADGRDAEMGNPIVQLLAIVQTINTTKFGSILSGTLATCNSPASELTSHTLFKDGDVMKKYIEKLRQYIVANPIQFDDDCDHPALDSLYWHYSECHNMSNDKTKAASRALNEHLGGLSFRENDRVFSLVGALCAEHERIAFLAGLQLGAQLMLELTESGAGDE